MKGNITEFIDTKISQLRSLGVDPSDYELDHFGYQTSSPEDYDLQKKQAESTDELYRETVVNGRRVAIFKLKDPLVHGKYKISAFELLEPKPGQICSSGLDHIEFVLDVSFNTFVTKHTHVDWDLSMMNRQEFPKITYKFQDGTGVKFHPVNILQE